MKGIKPMQTVTLEQLPAHFSVAPIEQTIDLGHTLIHITNAGTKDNPCRYVVINDMYGNTTISPSFFN
jgi:hypothetical protein